MDFDYKIEQEKVKRRRGLSDALLKQSMEPMQTQVIGGVAIRNNPLGVLAKMLQGVAAAKYDESLDEEDRALKDQQKNQIATALENYNKKLEPRAEQGTFGDPNYLPAYEPSPQDRQAAAIELAGSLGNSEDVAKTLLAQALKGQELKAYKPGDILADDRGNVVKTFPKEKEYQSDIGKLLGDKELAQQRGLDPSTLGYFDNQLGAKGAPKIDTIGGGGNTQLSVVYDPDGTKFPNAPHKDGFAVLGSRQAVANTNNNISLNTEKTYAGHVAGKLADMDVAAIDAAQSAPDRIRNAQQIKQLLKTSPITGTGANARLAFEKALSTGGLIDGDRVKNTEELVSLLASSTLDAIKTSGLGTSQGFTDKDRTFLEKARAGNIEINNQTLWTLADLNERSARASIKRGNKVAARIKNNPSFGSVGQDLEVQEPTAEAPRVRRYNPATGRIE